MNMLVDSHCHLDFDDFAAEGLAEIVGRARSAGVGHFLTISTHLTRFERIKSVAEAFPFIFCSVGTHPHNAGEAGEVDASKADILRLAAYKKTVAIGETGLDYHYNHASKEDQHAVFARHIEAAAEADLPLIIHSRDAEQDTMRLLRDVGQGKVKGVMHCFTGTQWLADQALDIGFYISFSGVITFKKSDDLRAVVKTVPLDRMLVETDSPYLAPMPNRGKRNEPAFVTHTAVTAAALKDTPKADFAKATTDNFFRLFSRAVRVGLSR
jgi:TatD DNase family protein